MWGESESLVRMFSKSAAGGGYLNVSLDHTNHTELVSHSHASGCICTRLAANYGDLKRCVAIAFAVSVCHVEV